MVAGTLCFMLVLYKAPVLCALVLPSVCAHETALQVEHTAG